MEDKDIKDGLNKIDFSLGLGIAYKLENNLFFDARYNYGLTKLDKEEDLKMQNGVFQLSVGYMF